MLNCKKYTSVVKEQFKRIVDKLKSLPQEIFPAQTQKRE